MGVYCSTWDLYVADLICASCEMRFCSMAQQNFLVYIRYVKFGVVINHCAAQISTEMRSITYYMAINPTRRGAISGHKGNWSKVCYISFTFWQISFNNSMLNSGVTLWNTLGFLRLIYRDTIVVVATKLTWLSKTIRMLILLYQPTSQYIMYSLGPSIDV